MRVNKKSIIIWMAYIFIVCSTYGQMVRDTVMPEQIDKMVMQLMDKGNIPGLSMVLINNGSVSLKSYGYADMASKRHMTDSTLFELASCSKAFTALAVVKLMKEGKINPKGLVTDYLSWWRVSYRGKPANVTIQQLLHHTSGIPWNTISDIPATNADNALEQTVRRLKGQKLHHLPGMKYEYATINYDVLALIIQQVTGMSFERYLQDSIINSIGMDYTSVGVPIDNKLMSTGYKVSFFKARPYDPPVYKGNNAAGYVISNARDMAKWLEIQMGMVRSRWSTLAKVTQQRDELVAFHDTAFYGMGWEISLNGSNEIFHSGLNPSFTSFVAFRPRKALGVVVLANSNSNYTSLIGDNVLKLMAGQPVIKHFDQDNNGDRTFSNLSIIMLMYILIIGIFLILTLIDIACKRRKYETFTWSRLLIFARSLLLIIPFLFGIYLFPRAFSGFSWEAVLVWSPISLEILVKLTLLAVLSTYIVYFLSLMYPNSNSYRRIAPQIVLISILSGLANIFLIIIITSAIGSDIKIAYLIFYYVLMLSVYLLGRKYVETALIKLTNRLIYDLKINIITRIFSTSYEKFEKIDRGRIYTVLNDDVTYIGQSAGIIVSLITSFITAIGALAYLASVAFWAACVTFFLVISLATLYYLVSKRTNIYFEEARSERNVYVRLINGMLDGFKEISLHKNKRLQYRDDVTKSAEVYRGKRSAADIRFVNAFLIGESLLVILLGVISLGMSRMFPYLDRATITSFVIILLYLIGPINNILGAVPQLLQLRIAWRRIQQFLKDIPANLELDKLPDVKESVIKNISAENVMFQYKNTEGENVFEVGPINLEIRQGEIIFIVGGNGSGKTTLAKLLTGLYAPDQGTFFINGKAESSYKLGELFSTVFNPPYLFDKLYDIDCDATLEESTRYLKILQLEEKVAIKEGKYTTTSLSSGQRKRLALLQCYLEDSPICLFDEWAADQDPEYRAFFYRTLLPHMKMLNKIVIVITHDEYYFGMADRILKMKRGKLEQVFIEEANP